MLIRRHFDYSPRSLKVKPSGDAIETSLLIAIRAFHRFGIKVMTHPVKAYIIIRKSLVKIFEREFLHLGLSHVEPLLATA